MFDDSFKAAFRAAGKLNGKLYEETITAFYTDLAESWPEGSVVIDCGAHHGLHSRPMSTLRTVGRVIAVEASPSTHASFAGKIQKTPALAKIDLRHAAVQADPTATSVDFYISKTHSGRSGLNPLTRGREGIEFELPVQVPASTIDKLAAGVMERVRFIKLDLEGGEFAALQGARQTLAAARPICVFENGKATPAQNGYTTAEFLAYLESFGLKVANFFGEAVTADTFSSSRYAWAFPIADFDACIERLRRLVAAASEKSGAPPASR